MRKMFIAIVVVD